MRAIVCRSYGPPENLEEIELESEILNPREVRIQVQAAGVGFVDGLLIQGRYQVKPPLPYYPGSEFSGIVSEVGNEVTRVQPGQSVMGLAGSGAFSEEVVMPAHRVYALPDGIDHATAASLFINYATALYGLRDCGRLQPGETVLVLGAAGGVGSAAISVAKAMGAQVIAAASSDQKRQAALRSGADSVIDYSRPDWRDELKTGPELNLVYDPVGGSFSEPAFRSLSPGGRFLVVGFAAGEIPAIPLNLALLKRSSIVGVDWGGEARANPGINETLLRTLFDWLSAGKLKPAETVQRPISEIREALNEQLAGEVVGKLVLMRS